MSPLSSLPPLLTYTTVTGSGTNPAGSPREYPASSVHPSVPVDREAQHARHRRSESPSESAKPGARDKQVGEFDEAELKLLTELKARDREVRAHEAAHQAVGGQYAGAMSFTYQRGPDGAQYAVGGEVSIDISQVHGDPQATIEKMRVVRAAAMAPAQPSGQDRAVAAQAMQTMLQAQSELALERDVSEPEKEASEQTSRTGEQARSTYQTVAGYDSEFIPSSDGFLSVSA